MSQDISVGETETDPFPSHSNKMRIFPSISFLFGVGGGDLLKHPKAGNPAATIPTPSSVPASFGKTLLSPLQPPPPSPSSSSLFPPPLPPPPPPPAQLEKPCPINFFLVQVEWCYKSIADWVTCGDNTPVCFVSTRRSFFGRCLAEACSLHASVPRSIE